MHALKVYVGVLLVLFALDCLWIGVVAAPLYRGQLHGFLRVSGGDLRPIMWAAVLVYLALAAGIVGFVLPRVPAAAPLLQAVVAGAAFGFVIYAVYDFTNYSLLRGWPLKVTLVDIAWGTALNAIAACVGAALDRSLS